MVLRTFSPARAWRPAVVARLARTLGRTICTVPNRSTTNTSMTSILWKAAALLLLSANSYAQDWSSCASELDSLRRRASDASSVAQDMEYKHGRLKSAENDLRQCLSAPQVFDLLRDGCRSKRSDYESAKSAYASQLDSLKSRLDDVDSKIRNVSGSCGIDLSRTLGPPPTVPAGVKSPEQCAVYLRYKGRLPAQALLDTCSKQMSLEECRKCLN